MSGSHQFWRALESVNGLRAVTAEWRALLGEAYEGASRYLTPDGTRASAYPCLARSPCGCAHDVIEHGADDIVAVCCCEPRRCDTFPVTRADVLVYEVDRRALGDVVAVALGADAQHAAASGLPLTWSLGTYSPRPHHRFAVYLTVQTEPADLRRVADALIAHEGRPFILAAPTGDLLMPDCEDVIRRANAHFLALADDFVLDPAGEVSSCRPTSEVLRPFLTAVLPKKPPHDWSGPALPAKKAAKMLGLPSGDALLKAVRLDRVHEGDPLYALRQGGPGRTRGGAFHEDAVAHVAGELGRAGVQYTAGVAERMERARKAKAATPRPDPSKAERRFMQSLVREENGQ